MKLQESARSNQIEIQMEFFFRKQIELTKTLKSKYVN